MKLALFLPLALLASGCASSSQTHAIHASTDESRPAALSDSPHLLPNQPTYATQDDAISALLAASRAGDLRGVSRIIGLPENEIATTDAARNTELASFFAREYDSFHNLVPDAAAPDTRARLFIGKDNYPIASPLVRQSAADGGLWFFDSAGGKQELVDRFISENELATIGVCRAYVQAQYEYYAEDRNADDVLEYAQQLGSSKGQRDGLYWHTEQPEPESPLGPLVAQARASGYLKGSVRQLDEPRPYHGYLFQILTRQGPAAPGGAHDYVINNHMIAGFALVAYPAAWNKTGTMTFLVGANGKVYQKDLGEKTTAIAGELTEYNPDASWSLVTE